MRVCVSACAHTCVRECVCERVYSAVVWQVRSAATQRDARGQPLVQLAGAGTASGVQWKSAILAQFNSIQFNVMGTYLYICNFES